MADWSAVYLTIVAATTPAMAVWGYAVFSGAMVMIRLTGDVVVVRLGATIAAGVSGSLAAIGVGMVIIVPTPVVVGFGLMGIGHAIILPLAFARAANDPTTAPGVAIASVATLGYGGMLLGPAVIGFIAATSSLQVDFGLMFLLASTMIALAPIPRRQSSALT